MPEIQSVGPDEASVPSQPGAVIAPGSLPAPIPEAPEVSTQQPPVLIPPAPAQAPIVQQPAAEQPAPSAIPEPYAAPQPPQQPQPPQAAQYQDQDSDESIQWTASEFVAHQKSSIWYGKLLGAAIVVAAIIYFLTRDYITTAIVLLAAGAFGIIAARKPREQAYHLDDHGVTIGDKYYDYAMFRSFSVLPEGDLLSVIFMPLKRFGLLRTIYFTAQQEDPIMDILIPRLPFEDRQVDPVDRLMQRIRF